MARFTVALDPEQKQILLKALRSYATQHLVREGLRDRAVMKMRQDQADLLSEEVIVAHAALIQMSSRSAILAERHACLALVALIEV